MSPNEEGISRLKPVAYFHYKETQALAGGKPNRILEIGAGSGVGVAIEKLGNPDCKITVLDLPEVIAIAFVFLRATFPDLQIALPNEPTGDSDIRFLTPLQVDELEPESFDRVTNTSSFAEMPITSVNNYIKLAHHVLKPGGKLISSNQKISRHIPGNSIDRYELSAFKGIRYETPQAWQKHSKHLGIDVVFLEAVK